MVIGDLAARHWFASLVYLLNNTASPIEVADGFPRHSSLAAGDACAWPADRVHRGGYDFSGWGHIPKSTPCHTAWYGSRAGTLHNLTMNHPPGSKAWWGRGTARDVMTLLLREKLLFTSWRSPPSRRATGEALPAVEVSYLWKGVIRTSGSYKQQHARHLASVASKVWD